MDDHDFRMNLMICNIIRNLQLHIFILQTRIVMTFNFLIFHDRFICIPLSILIKDIYSSN